jgi:hypothetical protein
VRAALRASLLLGGLLACSGAIGCGGGGEEGSGSSSARAAERKEKPVTEEGKEWGGWRWKGRREDCFFLYRNQCFAKLDEACRAANCRKSDCGHDDSAPAVVRCEK